MERGKKGGGGSQPNIQTKKEQTDKTPRQMVKATLNRQEYPKNFTHSQREKERKKETTKNKNRNQRVKDQPNQ